MWSLMKMHSGTIPVVRKEARLDVIWIVIHSQFSTEECMLEREKSGMTRVLIWAFLLLQIQVTLNLDHPMECTMRILYLR
jgi:hypothetical protein